MTRKKMSSMKHPGMSRRKTLQVTVGSLTVPFVASVVSAGSEEEPVVMRRQGSWDKPLSVAEMMNLKRRALRKHKQRGGDVEGDSFVNAVPGFPDHAALVDYTVGIRQDGVPIQHVGIAGDEGSVKSVQKDADKEAMRIREDARSRGGES